jgi:DNA-binding MarR family transcriptional regulator
MSTNESLELYTELHRLGRQLHRVSHREWREHGHYREQSRFLRLIQEHDGIIQRDLAEEMDVRPSSMTEMLARMEALGLIRRVQDEKDQRAVHIYLTDAGRAMAGESAGTTEALVSEMFKNMTEEEIGTMLALTKKLAEGLDSMAPADDPRERHHGPHHGPHHGSCEDPYGEGERRHHGPGGPQRHD